jgi:GNAT superfamily N-acetyltransferase
MVPCPVHACSIGPLVRLSVGKRPAALMCRCGPKRYGGGVLEDGIELYRASFARRSAAMASAGQTVAAQPGICGVLGSPHAHNGRLLITDDRAEPTLQALLPTIPAQIVNVFKTASRCRALIEGAGHWEGEDATAMMCPDLASVEAWPMPSGLTVRPVLRANGDPADGVALDRAAAACLRADPQTAGLPLVGFLAFLRSLPASTRLLAAVDGQDHVRATAGASALGLDANVYFVSTDSEWRYRGVATAMTAAALIWARETGARQAALDASPAGLSIYLRLGFEAIASSTLFARFG